MGLFYDFRLPSGPPFERHYAEVFDQIAWAEELGYESAWVSAHHFTDDGYIPSPLLALAHVAARVQRMRLGTNLLIPGLYHPLRVAEDCAVLSIISGGRFDLGCAIGYREIEFAAFGRSVRQRPSLFEEFVEIARRAWAGESVAYEGRRNSVPDVRVTPVPSTPPRIFVGGSAPAAIERAARIGDGFLSARNRHHATYLDAVERVGGDRDAATIAAIQWLVIAPDPERTWAEIGRHALYQLNANISHGAYPRRALEHPDEALESGGGPYLLLDAAGAVDYIGELVRRCPQIEDVHLFACIPGEPLDSGAERVEYVARHVIPRLSEVPC